MILDALAMKLLKFLKRKKIKTFYSDEYYFLPGSITKKRNL